MRAELTRLDRYLAGECSPDEAEQIRTELAVDSTLRALVEALGRAVRPQAQSGARNDDAAWARIRSEIGSTSSTGVPARVPRHFVALRFAGESGGRAWRRIALGLSASAALAFAVIRFGGMPAAGHGAARRYATGAGQQARVTLDDGTRVTLAPNTVLRADRVGATGPRVVELDGEAYFDVANASSAPFVVRTGAVTTRVLGTVFLVRHYPGDGRTVVAVVSGKVAVASGGRAAGVPVTAGWVANVADSGVSTSPVGDTARYAGWVNGRLVFDEAPATEVLSALSRWYGYQFRLADSAIAAQNLTAVVSTRSSAEALSTLKTLLDVDLTFDGNVVTLTPRHVSESAPRSRRGALRDVMSHSTEVGR